MTMGGMMVGSSSEAPERGDVALRGVHLRVERQGKKELVPGLGILSGYVLVERNTGEQVLRLSEASDPARVLAQWDAAFEAAHSAARRGNR